MSACTSLSSLFDPRGARTDRGRAGPNAIVGSTPPPSDLGYRADHDVAQVDVARLEALVAVVDGVGIAEIWRYGGR